MNFLTLRVDFNRIDEDRRIPVLLVRENAGIRLVAGETVTLRDYEENECEGIVTEITDKVALVEPEWGTWRPADTVRLSAVPDTPTDDLMAALRASIKQGMKPKKKTKTLGRKTKLREYA